jgi:hypothetical protein
MQDDRFSTHVFKRYAPIGKRFRSEGRRWMPCQIVVGPTGRGNQPESRNDLNRAQKFVEIHRDYPCSYKLCETPIISP